MPRNEKGQLLPGTVLNPNGRPPKAWTMSSLIAEALEEVESQSGKSFKHLVAKRLAHMAVGGDIQAIKEINDRVDGRPVQRQIIEGDSEQPLVIHSFTGLLDSIYNEPERTDQPPQDGESGRKS